MSRIVSFFGLFLMICSIIYWIGFSFDQPYEGAYNQVQRVLSGRDTITALSLGNSHAASIHYPSLGIQGGYDLSAGFMDVFELYHLAQYVLPKMSNLNYVFIPIPYYFFPFDNAAFDDEYQLSFRKRTYFMTPQFSLIGEDPVNLVHAKISPIVRSDHWKGVCVSLLKSKLAQIAHLCPVQEPLPTDDFLLKHAKGRVKQNKKQAEEMLLGHPNLLNDSENRFVDLLNLFEKFSITPVFYTPSYHAHYSERFDATIKNKSITIIQRLKKEKKIMYFDFSQDSALSTKDEFYRDSDHYTIFGRQVFSKQLRDSLIKYEIIQL